MIKPPFRLAVPATGSASVLGSAADPGDPPAAPGPRARLGELDPHLHCSILGTCLSTGELRKLMARFLFVRDQSDLEVHHEAVRMASMGGPVAKALHKALEQRHDATVRRFAAARDAGALAALWTEALRAGEVPGAYWATLTHRQVTPELRQRVFGEVHMLSHLVGAANRADIRRLVALERENGELHERLERQQLRSNETLDERERHLTDLRRRLGDSEAARFALQAERSRQAEVVPDGSDSAAKIALQAERRERAEQAAAAAEAEASRLRQELERVRHDLQALGRELGAAEIQLRERAAGAATALASRLRGRRILYVGGRASSTPSIRELVERHGGEFGHHDGGLEDRKGLLASGVGWADLVVFPVDCVDHDSAGNLKRLCARSAVAWLPLRSASVASFAATLSDDPPDAGDQPPVCCHHG